MNQESEWMGAALMESFDSGAHSQNGTSLCLRLYATHRFALYFFLRNQLARSLKGICVGGSETKLKMWKKEAAPLRPPWLGIFAKSATSGKSLDCGGGAGLKVSAPCWARQLSRGVEWRLCTRSLLVGLRKRGWTHPEAAAWSWFHPLISSSSLLSEKAFRQKALSANQLANSHQPDI